MSTWSSPPSGSSPGPEPSKIYTKDDPIPRPKGAWGMYKAFNHLGLFINKYKSHFHSMHYDSADSTCPFFKLMDKCQDALNRHCTELVTSKTGKEVYKTWAHYSVKRQRFVKRRMIDDFPDLELFEDAWVIDILMQSKINNRRSNKQQHRLKMIRANKELSPETIRLRANDRAMDQTRRDIAELQAAVTDLDPVQLLPTPHTPPHIRDNREVEPAMYDGMSRLSTGPGKRHNMSAFIGTSTPDNVYIPHDHGVPSPTPLPISYKAPKCLNFAICGRQKDIKHGNTFRRVCQECTDKATALKTTGRNGRKLRATQKVAGAWSLAKEKKTQKDNFERSKQTKKTAAEKDEEALSAMKALRK